MDIVLYLCALFFAGLGILPYSVLKPFADRLAPDGSMERFTREFWLPLHIILIFLAILCIALLLWKHFSPKSYRDFFASLRKLPGRVVSDFRPFFADFRVALKSSKAESVLIVLIILAGIVVRLLMIDRPLEHDEAYSMAEWGRAGMRYAMGDYHLPNNHLFHTFLINLIYHFIGKDVPLLRMPVFLSGVLLIPVVWLLGKHLYSRFTGLTAAAFTAFAPFLIYYSVNARGYELMTFLTAVSLLLAAYLRKRKNLFGWAMFILSSALNFFTLPIALYPFGGICLWFLLAVLTNQTSDAYSGRWNFFKYLIAAGICTSILTMLLYAPLFRDSGFAAFFGNQYVGPVPPGEFTQTFISRMIDTYHAFCDTLPVPVWALIALGNILVLVFHPKACRLGVPYQAALVLCMAAIMVYQKPNLWPRTLLFFHPLLILWGSAGICYVLTALLKEQRIAYGLIFVLAVWAGITQFRVAADTHGVIGADEKAIRILLETEGENANKVLFVTAAADNAPLWMYADIAGLPYSIFDKLHRFDAVYALYNPQNDAYNKPSDLDDLLERYGPGKVFIQRKSEQILMDEPDGILYRFDIYEHAVEKAYGEKTD